MHSERLEFTGSTGAGLAGKLDLPDGAPRAFALFAHCFTCSKDVVAASRISRALTDFGIAVLRFDFTGLGGSDGDFANTNFTSNVADLVHAADYLRRHHEAPQLLIGHSLGGAAVLAAAEQLPETRAVATIGAPADPSHLLHLLADSREAILDDGEAEVCLASRTFRIRRQFLDDIAEQPQTERVRRLGAALLVMHSPTDEIVGIANAKQIFQAARHPKSFLSLDGADHLLTRRSDAEFVSTTLAAWAGRYLDAPAVSQVAAPTMPDTGGAVVVSESGVGRFGQRVRVGRHLFAADEPEPTGTDSGPSPYDLLLAGLGACTSMTLRMYADRKQWPLENVTVSLRHARVHARDCGDCATKTGHLDRIERTIHLVGDLDAEQRARLGEIADRCPVHRTLHGEVLVDTTVTTRSDHRELELHETAPLTAAPT
jgi:uncharacterized OsmC-like protein/alpha/beta superfamily hydrolase